MPKDARSVKGMTQSILRANTDSKLSGNEKTKVRRERADRIKNMNDSKNDVATEGSKQPIRNRAKPEQTTTTIAKIQRNMKNNGSFASSTIEVRPDLRTMNTSKSYGSLMISKRDSSTSRLNKPLKSMKHIAIKPSAKEIKIRVPLPDSISLPRPKDTYGRYSDTKLHSTKASSKKHLTSGHLSKTKTTLQPVSEIAEISNLDNDASF